MINFRRSFLILGIAFVGWLCIDLDYDAKDQDSLSRMLRWSPLSAQACMEWINAAGENPRLTNLHGLNCPQIYKVALEKFKTHLDSAIDVYGEAIKSASEKKSSVIIYYSPYSNIEGSIHNPHPPSHFSKKLSYTELQKRYTGVTEWRDAVAKELDHSLRMPWSTKLPIKAPPGTPVRFEIDGQPIAKGQSSTQIVKGDENARKLLGDRLDDNPNAIPNRAQDVADKAAGKSWQDNNGFVHFPDGSVTNVPVD